MQIRNLFPIVFLLILTLRAEQKEETFDGEYSSSQFSFVFHCETPFADPDVPGDICIHGPFAPKSRVTLLKKDISKTCVLETDEVFTWHDETSSFTATRLRSPNDCDPPNSYRVAVVGREVFEYEVLELEVVSDTQKIRKLNWLVQAQRALDEKIETSAGSQDIRWDYDSDAPPRIVLKLPIPSFEGYVLHYYGERIYDGNPRILIIGDRTYPLTGPCSFPWLRAFRLDDDFFLESGSGCCGCGWRDEFLFRITENGPERVFWNPNWGN
jgi:hypothetical protein